MTSPTVPGIGSFIQNIEGPQPSIPADWICIICQESHSDPSNALRKPVCACPNNHIFHRSCIVEWIRSIQPQCGRCPQCREQICRWDGLTPAEAAEWRAYLWRMDFNTALDSSGRIEAVWRSPFQLGTRPVTVNAGSGSTTGPVTLGTSINPGFPTAAPALRKNVGKNSFSCTDRTRRGWSTDTVINGHNYAELSRIPFSNQNTTTSMQPQNTQMVRDQLSATQTPQDIANQDSAMTTEARPSGTSETRHPNDGLRVDAGVNSRHMQPAATGTLGGGPPRAAVAPSRRRTQREESDTVRARRRVREPFAMESSEEATPPRGRYPRATSPRVAVGRPYPRNAGRIARRHRWNRAGATVREDTASSHASASAQTDERASSRFDERMPSYSDEQTYNNRAYAPQGVTSGNSNGVPARDYTNTTINHVVGVLTRGNGPVHFSMGNLVGPGSLPELTRSLPNHTAHLPLQGQGPQFVQSAHTPASAPRHTPGHTPGSTQEERGGIIMEDDEGRE